MDERRDRIGGERDRHGNRERSGNWSRELQHRGDSGGRQREGRALSARAVVERVLAVDERALLSGQKKRRGQRLEREIAAAVRVQHELVVFLLLLRQRRQISLVVVIKRAKRRTVFRLRNSAPIVDTIDPIDGFAAVRRARGLRD